MAQSTQWVFPFIAWWFSSSLCKQYQRVYLTIPVHICHITNTKTPCHVCLYPIISHYIQLYIYICIYIHIYNQISIYIYIMSFLDNCHIPLYHQVASTRLTTSMGLFIHMYIYIYMGLYIPYTFLVHISLRLPFGNQTWRAGKWTIEIGGFPSWKSIQFGDLPLPAMFDETRG